MEKSNKIRIQIDGAGMINKGAELMLFAILEEIENRCPSAEVLVNHRSCQVSVLNKYFNINIRRVPNNFVLYILRPLKIYSLLRRISLYIALKLSTKNPRKNINLLLDAGGYQYGDLWKHNKLSTRILNIYYSELKKNGVKIVLLPQSFDTFSKVESKNIARILGDFADIVFARDNISYNNLLQVNFPENKLSLYPDFTTSVNGEYIKTNIVSGKGVCIIPNSKMIERNIINNECYINFIMNVIHVIRKNGFIPFLLNHEGIDDDRICKKIIDIDKDIQYFNNLNGLQVKGLIKESYLVISSRFHGVASSLSSGVPCLATSWSHKYELLFKEYELEYCIIKLDASDIEEQIEHLLMPNVNCSMREKLLSRKQYIALKNRDMWNTVFHLLD